MSKLSLLLVINKLVAALTLALQYLYKAEADGLLQNCSRPPSYAIRIGNEAIKLAEEYLQEQREDHWL